MNDSAKPVSYHCGTVRAEVLRKALHTPAGGRVYDCWTTPAADPVSKAGKTTTESTASTASTASKASKAGPALFTAPHPRAKVGWAKAQFPPCPLLARTVPDLIEAMWALRDWADNPSYRKLERRAEFLERKAGTVRALPHATLHRVMTRARMPRLELLELFVKACGAEAHWDEWRRAWFAINAEPASRLPATARPSQRDATLGKHARQSWRRAPRSPPLAT